MPNSSIVAIGDELVGVIQTSGDDDVFMVSRQGMTIRFAQKEARGR